MSSRRGESQRFPGFRKKSSEVLSASSKSGSARPQFCDPFRENDFPFFKIADALLVGGNDRRHIGIGDAVEKLLDLPLDRRAVRLQRALGFNLGARRRLQSVLNIARAAAKTFSDGCMLRRIVANCASIVSRRTVWL
ncbi:MAG: hypothetical protein ACREF9_17280 [Opitutaceae bacterium]